MTPELRTRILSIAGVLLLVAAAPRSEPRKTPDPREQQVTLRRGSPAMLCGTLDGHDLRRLNGPTTLTAPSANGDPLSFRQDPAIVFPDYTGTIRFLEFLVAGDVSTVRFKRPDTNTSGVTETWNRTGTRIVGGRLVSVFAPSWPASELTRLLSFYYHGFDYPSLFWGEVLLPGSGTDSTRTRQIALRMSSRSIPASRTIQLSSTVQYASHVVNLVIPTFGDAWITQSADSFDQVAIARKFYENFQDTYDSLAIIPQAPLLPGFGGAHEVVKNDVSGVGLPLSDRSVSFGSGGALRGIELYPGHAFPTNEMSDHEITHQWADYFDWSRITGFSGNGFQPGSHSPLWAPNETLIGAVLFGARRAVQASDASYLIARTPVPVRQHEIALYAMGKLRADQVQPLVVFQNQFQFGSGVASLPNPGTAVTGDTKQITINDILGVHGSRSGPTPTQVRRATIVVSRSGFLSAAEMDYWNFFAQRLEDPDRTGAVSADGFVSFDRALSNEVDLQTDIAPKSSEKISQRLEVNFPSFSTRECPGVEFDQAVPTTVNTQLPVHITGRVTATDRTDFSQIVLRFARVGQADQAALRVTADLDRSGRFTLDFAFTNDQLGVYVMDILLFWPNAPSQFPRSSLSPFIVNPS